MTSNKLLAIGHSDRIIKASLIALVLLGALLAPRLIAYAPHFIFSRQGLLLAMAVAFIFIQKKPVLLIQLLSLSIWFSMVTAPLPIVGKFLRWAPIQEYLFYMIAVVGLLHVAFGKLEPSRKRVLIVVSLLFLPLFVMGALGLSRGLDLEFGPAYWRWSSTYPLAIIMALLIYIRTVEDAWRLGYVVTVGSAIFAALLMGLWVSGRILATENTLGGARLGGMLTTPGVSFYWDPVALGSTFAICIPFAVGLFTGSRHFKYKMLAALSSCILVVVVLSSGIRAAWIGAPIGILVTLVLLGKVSFRNILWGMGLLLFGLGVIRLTISGLSGNIEIMDRLVSVSSFSRIMSTQNLLVRQEIWFRHWQEVVQNPFIPFGYYYLNGLGNPHNTYIFLGMGTGFLGLVFFAILLTYCASRFLYGAFQVDRRVSVLASAAMGSLTTFLIVGITDSSFMDSWTTAVIFMLLGLGLTASCAGVSARPKLSGTGTMHWNSNRLTTQGLLDK